MLETEQSGSRRRPRNKSAGRGRTSLLASRGFRSVAPRVSGRPALSSATRLTPDIQSGRSFIDRGIQIAAGVPLQCDEGEDFRSFAYGLFGLDKLLCRARTVNTLTAVLNDIR